MTARMEADGLNELRAVLAKAGPEVVTEGKKVLARGALNIKKGAQARIQGLAHAPAYPRSIGYDVVWMGAQGRAEIGPDKDKRQGALGNILEYGTSKNPPYAHLGPALDYEGPVFERYVGDLGEEPFR
jgi:hypothetical protein